jgi:hypothetical protein
VRKASAAIACTLLLGGCGLLGGPLSDTSRRLGDIRSGTMDLSMVGATEGGQRSGFRLTGPFSIPDDESLPEADFNYTRYTGRTSETFGFIATGAEAFIEVGNQAYKLPASRANTFRGSENPSDGPLSELDLDSWAPDYEVKPGPNRSTELITGDLDVVRALNDIFAIARNFGAEELKELEGDEAERVQRAVKSAKLEVLTGKEDRLLRSLSMDVNLGAKAPENFGKALEGLLGVRFRLNLSIRNPNRDVNVQAPRNALPYERLARG